MTSSLNYVVPPGTAALSGGKLVIGEIKDEAPLIYPGRNVTVKIDDREVLEPTVISPKNNVEIIPHQEPCKLDFNLKVTEDNLKAYLEIIKKKGKRFILKDIPPAKKLQIEAVDFEEFDDFELTKEKLLDFLKTKKISFGIKEDVLSDLAAGLINEALVAEGIPAVKGKDAQIVQLFLHGQHQRDKETLEHGVISSRRIIMVEKGEELLQRIPPQPGKSGTDIFGNVIPAPAVRDISFQIGKGTKVVDEGNKVLADISGRLTVKNNYVAVHPVYLVEGEAAAQEGLINFNGDVIVKGNVMDGMIIKARGSIEVEGFAAHSKLIADQDITIEKSAVGCSIKAGGNVLLYRQVKEQLIRTLEQAVELVKALKQIKKTIQKTAEQQKDGAILKLLLEKKFAELPQLFSSTSQLLKEFTIEHDEEFQEKLNNVISIVNTWETKTTGLGPLEINSIGEIEYMLRSLNTCCRNLWSCINDVSEEAVISCSYIQNCDLEASGKINITGKGAYYSKLVCGGKVYILGQPGVFRGGSITAIGDVWIRELGSDAETKTFVQISKDAVIRADIVYPGTTLKAGSQIKKVTIRETNFEFPDKQ